MKDGTFTHLGFIVHFEEEPICASPCVLIWTPYPWKVKILHPLTVPHCRMRSYLEKFAYVSITKRHSMRKIPKYPNDNVITAPFQSHSDSIRIPENVDTRYIRSQRRSQTILRLGKRWTVKTAQPTDSKSANAHPYVWGADLDRRFERDRRDKPPKRTW